jgi:hypothetical protein
MNTFAIAKPALQLVVQFGVQLMAEDLAAVFAGIIVIILLRRLLRKKT